MRDNGPVTNREIEMPTGSIIVSKTDLKGKITFVNQDFIDISGFSEEELMGQPHNLVRHPHMPVEAFADLWGTIQAGLPWEGVVKNRTKNGDHYWVLANATPLMTGSTITGFISIRTKPTRDQIAQAEALYEKIRTGKAKDIALKNGRVLSKNATERAARLAGSVSGRLGGVLIVLGLMLALVGWLSMNGMNGMDQSVEEIYRDDTVPSVDLGIISTLAFEDFELISLAQSELVHGTPKQSIAERLDKIAANEDAINQKWTAYVRGARSDDASALQTKFENARDALLKQAMAPTIALIKAGDAAKLDEQIDTTYRPLFLNYVSALNALMENKRAAAKTTREEASHQFHVRFAYTSALLLISLFAAGALGVWIMRVVRRPIVIMADHMDAIASGNINYHVPHATVPEFDRLYSSLRSLRAKMIYSIQESEEIARKGDDTLRLEMLALTKTLEDEVQDAVGEISNLSSRLSESATNLLHVSDDLNVKASEVAESVRTTTGNVQTVAGATEELEATSREILSQIDNSSRLALAARERVTAASQKVDGLSDATSQIGTVVSIIRKIAGQTRLLALNATIEAASAGEAGKGFAIVAGEVKGLAGQTEEAIGIVNSQAQKITTETHEAVEGVNAVAATIQEIDTIAVEIARSAAEQRSATAEIMASASQAADHTLLVANNMEAVVEGVDVAGKTARLVNELSTNVHTDIASLQRRLYVIMRASYGGNRRLIKRVTTAIPFTARFPNATFNGFTGDISTGGAMLIVNGETIDDLAQDGMLELEGVGELSIRLISQESHGMLVHFEKVSEESLNALEEVMHRSIENDARHIKYAEAVSDPAGKALEQAVREGTISMEDLFALRYTPIEGTEPVQVIAKHTEIAERVFPSLIEPPLSSDANIVFCCITDRKGYIAVHNRKYSNPQKPGDTKWNTANCRNRRIFDDRTGIMAARCTKPIVQTYSRDMGGGEFVLMKEIDVPISVNGKRWGAVRMGIKL